MKRALWAVVVFVLAAGSVWGKEGVDLQKFLTETQRLQQGKDYLYNPFTGSKLVPTPPKAAPKNANE